MNLLLKYYDVKFYWDSDNPKIDLLLKKELKVCQVPLMKNERQPVSGSELRYYLHYLGNTPEIYKLYEQRKAIFSKNKRVEWYIKTFKKVISKDDLKKLKKYLKHYGDKLSVALKDHYASDAGIITKEKLKKRSEYWAPIIGKHNSELHKDPDWVQMMDDKYYKNVEYLNNKSKILKKSALDNRDAILIRNREPERCKKIGIAASKMWANWKVNDPEKYKQLLRTGNIKHYEYKGIKMTNIEFLIAGILDELNVIWEYEHIFHFENITCIPDFYLPNYNIIIECYGDYWHGNPNFFNEDTILFKKMLITDKWEHDKIRKKLFELNNFLYIVYWENEIHSNLITIKNEIKEQIKLNTYE